MRVRVRRRAREMNFTKRPMTGQTIMIIDFSARRFKKLKEEFCDSVSIQIVAFERILE